MVRAGNKGTYKHMGVESKKLCDTDLCKNLPTSQNYSFGNGQYSGTFLHCENGGHRQPSQSKKDYDYCRVFSRNNVVADH